MKDTRMLFESIPDTVIITDTYGYILDFNRKTPFEDLKKGKRLTSFITDCFEDSEGDFTISDRVYRRYTAKLDNGKNDTGFTVRLSDMTEEANLDEQLKKRSLELSELETRLSESNAELTDFVMRVKELADYSEQLRIARVIHDDYGHALTELFAICQMCLTLKDTDPEKCRQLLLEGSEICRKATEEKRKAEFSSLAELLYDFAGKSVLPAEVTVTGDEPSFIKEKYEIIGTVCKEAYHNTLDHSLAERFCISAEMAEEQVTLTLTDDGSFHGTFEKGFGLSAMENSVRASGGTVTFIAEEGKSFTVRATWRRE